MAQSATLNGIVYTIPDVGDNDWGQNVTDYLAAIPGAVLQKSGGAFALTAEVNFGASFGLNSIYFKSRTANPASAGAVRLAVSDVVSWRNNANGGDLDLGVDAADALIYGSNKVVTVAGGFTLVDTLTFANQKGIRFSEQTANGSNYLELVAPDAVTSNVTLKLPDGDGSSGQVLSTNGSGALGWINAAGGGTTNSGVKGRLAVYPADGTTLDDVVTMTNPVEVAIAAHGQATVVTIPDGGQTTASFVLTEGTQTVNGAKTLTGATIVSVASAAAFSVSNNNAFKVDSTNVLVSIGTATMTHPLHILKSVTGAATVFALENNEATNAASHAQVQVITGGASAGDPFLTFYNGIQNISIGLDNSDSDALCITGASTLNGTNLLKLTTAGALTVASTLTLPLTSNQIVLGTTNTVTISSTAPAAPSVYTIPDVGTTADFVLTAGTQTIAGAKTFSSAVTITPTTNQIVLGVTNTTTISATAPAASRVYTLPDVGGAADFVMTLGTQTIGGTKIFSNSVGAGGVSPTARFHAEVPDAPSEAYLKFTKTGIVTWTLQTGSNADMVLVSDAANSDFYFSTNIRSILFNDGSAARPVISFASDLDTGIYRAGSNAIELAAGGARALQVDDASTGGLTRMIVWDTTAAAMKRVSVGATDSGGSGFKLLRIPN